MITIKQYFGAQNGAPAAHLKNAGELLRRVNALLEQAPHAPINPVTGSQVSGEKWGGYRTQDCPIGAPKSAHKTGEAVDLYDPQGSLDAWLTDERLESAQLYREAPAATHGWCHLTTRAPASGHRTFNP